MFVKKVKTGYILLELLIASAIGAFVLGALFTSFNQVNKSLQIVDTIASIDMRTLLVNNQLERDISGAFVPQERKVKKLTEKDKSQVNKKNDKDKKKEYENVPLKKAFLSKNKGQNLDLLTFITTNPIKSFASQSKGVAIKPCIARVMYTLVPEKSLNSRDKKRSFSLQRQEDISIGFTDFQKKKPRAYSLIKNIKKLSVQYTVTISKDKKLQSQGESQVPEKDEKIEYKTFNKWGEQEIEKTKKNRPDLCTFKIELWDDTKKTFRDFEYKIYIMQTNNKVKEKKKQKTKKESQKSQTGGAKK